MLTLFARLYYVQLLDPNKPVQSAHLLHDGAIVVPAPRGLIVDARGRPLVANTSTQVITVDRDVLRSAPTTGAPCSPGSAALLHDAATGWPRRSRRARRRCPAPCWTGEPYAPVPVATDAPDRASCSRSASTASSSPASPSRR